MISNSYNRPIELHNVQNNMIGDRLAMTGDFQTFQQEPHSKTNPVFNRKFLSPQ